MRHSILIVVMLVMTVAVPSVFAQAEMPAGGDEGRRFMYEWKDAEGVVHITDDPDKVPHEYRARVRKIEPRQSQETTSSGQQLQTPPAAPPSENNDERRKAEWQQRVKDWKGRLAAAESRYRELEQERNSISTGAYAPLENRSKAMQIEQKMREATQDISEARNMLENVIPEEARKAGVPPGWLRE